MEGKLFIDGQDAYTTYGAFVTEGGYNSLVAYPSLKAVPFNDWHEENGIEPDLSNPVLDGRQCSVNFAFSGPGDGFERFLAALSGEGSYHEFDCREIGRSYTLRLVSQGSMNIVQGLKTVTLTLADDFPLADYTPLAPSSAIPPSDEYKIDGKRLTDYGIKVLLGSLAEIEKAPAVKPNLTINISTLPGILYDGSGVKYQSKDITLNCLMRASSLTELWRNYDALLYDLSRSGGRTLTVAATESQYPCFYKGSSVKNFHTSPGPWLEFALTLTVYES